MSIAGANITGAKLHSFVIVGTFVVLIPLFGALAAFFGPYSLLPPVAIIGSIMAFMLPLDIVLMATLVIAAVIAGSLEYFGGVSQGFWLPYLLGLLLAVRGLGERLRSHSAKSSLRNMPRHGDIGISTALKISAILYFGVTLFGLVIAAPSVAQVVVGAKNYFFLWGLLLVLIWSPWQVASSARFWTTVVAVAILQLPIALYQRIFIAARRHDTAAWDSVVGTLGGDPSGGGNSAAMAIICCIALAVLVLRMRDRQLKVVIGIPLLVFCIAPIALAEVKAAFVWLTVVFLVLTWQYFRREPVRAIGSALIGLALLAGLGLLYISAYKEQMGSSTTLESIYEKQIKYSLDPNEFSSQYKRLGRMTSLVYWWNQHDIAGNPVEVLFGHGLGASRSVSSLGISALAKRLPFAVDGTAASALLWDVGLLGSVSFVLFLTSAGFGCLSLSRNMCMTQSWRETTALSGIVLISSLVGLFYNKDAIDNAALQILIMFSIGQFLLAKRLITRNVQLISISPVTHGRSGSQLSQDHG